MEQHNPLREVGKNLRTLRKGRGLSQEQLAEKVGLHPLTIGEHERGEMPNGMLITTLTAYCDALECSADELLGRSVETPIGELRTAPLYFIDEAILRKVLAASSRAELEALQVKLIPWAYVVEPGERLVEESVWKREGDKVAAIRRRFSRRK